LAAHGLAIREGLKERSRSRTQQLKRNTWNRFLS
jgi:hypothetical protein